MDELERSTIEARIATLEGMLGSGVSSVRQGDESVTFRSTGEIAREIARLRALLVPRASRRRVRYITQLCKGL